MITTHRNVRRAIQVREDYGKLLAVIPSWAKRQVKQAILNSSIKDECPNVTSAVVDMVIDKVWDAIMEAIGCGIPLLGAITGAEVLRCLRILAVFACPAPSQHKEVREHALEPLRDDAQAVLTAQAKARLARLFEEWRASG